MHRYIWSPVVVALLVAQTVFAQLPISIPATQGISAERLGRMDAVIAASIEKKELPGAVVLVARHGKIVWRKAYGARAVEPLREAFTLDTILHLARRNHVAATTTSRVTS